MDFRILSTNFCKEYIDKISVNENLTNVYFLNNAYITYNNQEYVGFENYIKKIPIYPNNIATIQHMSCQPTHENGLIINLIYTREVGFMKRTERFNIIFIIKNIYNNYIISNMIITTGQNN